MQICVPVLFLSQTVLLYLSRFLRAPDKFMNDRTGVSDTLTSHNRFLFVYLRETEEMTHGGSEDETETLMQRQTEEGSFCL